MLHGAVEAAEHGVVFQQIDHIIHVCFPQVDAADLILIGLLRQNAQDHAADAAETIDTDLDSHNLFPFYIRPQGASFCSVYIIPNGPGSCLPFLCKMVHKIPGNFS